MAGSKSDFLEKAILNFLLGGTALSPGAAVFLALSSAAYSDAATGTAMTELSGGGYARLSVTRNTTNFPAATGTSPGSISNGVAQTFPAASGAQGTAASFYICDASTVGNIYYGADLTASKTIGTGDTASFAIGAITVTED